MDYDVFLSHNSKDKPAVEEIGRRLQNTYSLICWLDKWNLVPGEPWQEALEEALDDCQTVAVFVGPNTISPWENEEMRSTLESRVHDKSRRVVPALLPGAPDNRDLKLPRFLTRLTWVDFRAGLEDKDALYRLYCGITGKAPGAPAGEIKPDVSKGLPPGSYMPFPRNALFTGREEDLEKLKAAILGRGGRPSAPTTGTVITQAITGIGGIGKTQLAVEFAYRYGHRFKGVHWLDLRDPDAMDASIALCGTHMGLAYTDQREQVAHALHTWQTDGPRLLILDNLEDVTKTGTVLSRFQHPSLRILVTSRRKDFPKSAGLQTQELDTFSEIESLDFLEKTLERLESEEARKKLSGKLGYLPLALELAASYININGLDISEYLGELEEILTHESMQDDWFKELEITNPTEHEQSLLATFELSWQEVKSETAQMLFMLAGYCAPNTPIPRLIFEKTLEVKKKEFTKAIYRLNALGLLIASDDLTTIHPLSAAFARIADKDNEQLSKVSDTIFSLSASANQSGLPLQMQPYQQHARACGEFAEKAALEIAGSLWNEFGYSLWQIADHAGAQAAYERAIKISEAAFGPDHPQVATFVNNLGLVLQVLGDLQGAQAAFERALKIDETAFGPDHPSVAIRVNNLGLVLQDLGDLKGAQAAYQRALKIDEAAFGPDHPQVATFVNNLGLVLGDLGDLKGAQAAYERALKIFKQFLPEGHPNIKVVEGNLRSLEEK